MLPLPNYLVYFQVAATTPRCGYQHCSAFWLCSYLMYKVTFTSFRFSFPCIGNPWGAYIHINKLEMFSFGECVGQGGLWRVRMIHVCCLIINTHTHTHTHTLAVQTDTNNPEQSTYHIIKNPVTLMCKKLKYIFNVYCWWTIIMNVHKLFEVEQHEQLCTTL